MPALLLLWWISRTLIWPVTRPICCAVTSAERVNYQLPGLVIVREIEQQHGPTVQVEDLRLPAKAPGTRSTACFPAHAMTD